MKDFRQLQIWHKAHAFVLTLYDKTQSFPRDERFGLTSQMGRAAVSITSNIAEGCGRQGDAELARFCQIAMGSPSEVECQLLLARDLGFLESSDFRQLDDQLSVVKRMHNSFIQKLTANR